ncbi:hypothetical protein N8371_08655 [Vicingaceae bacterium]|nr:hypothetical protein [Vicingaceae bacterium]
MKLKERNANTNIIQDFIVSNNNLEGFCGDGTSIIDTPDLEIKHSFADQVYIRQMTMLPNQIVIGAIHNHEHVWFLLKGKVSINDNGVIIDHIAPCYMVSQPGSKRAIYAHEHSIFVNIHKNPSNTKDIDKLEKEIVSITEEDFNKKNN